MNVQLSLADFYRIGLEKNYEVGISTTISNNAPDSPQIAKKQVPKTPVQASISDNNNANICSSILKTMDSPQISKIPLPGTSTTHQASTQMSGDLNKTLGKSRNSQEIAKPPQQEVNKTPKKLLESPSPAQINNWNRTFSNHPMDSPEFAKQQKEDRKNKSVASLDALNNLKQVLQSPVVQAYPPLTGAQ